MKAKGGPHSLIERPVVLALDAPPAAEAPEPALFAAAGLDAEFIDAAGAPSPADIERADVILTWRAPVNETLVRAARRCLVVLHYGPGAGRGVPPVDLEAARETGVYVASIPDFATASWVEETWRLIELLAGGVPDLDLPRRKLSALRLGLVGFGQVGLRVARRARELKMEVWACDPFAAEEPFLTAGVKRCDLATVCGGADILSLHASMSPSARGLVGADQLLLLKRGALLINTADPELVDLHALSAALARRRPLAAAFDEDLAALLPSDHPLLGQPRLIHAPRRAGASEADTISRRRRAAELILDILHGARPAHLLIDPPCPRHILLQPPA